MNFVYITSKAGYFELVGNTFNEFNPDEYQPATGNWVHVKGPSVINVINGAIENVDTIDNLNGTWAEDFNKWRASRETTECVHNWHAEIGFTNVYNVCVKCGQKRE